MYIVLHIWGVNSDPIAIMKRKEKALCICKVDLKLCWILKSQFQFPLRKDMELKSINLKDLPVSLNASIVVAVKSRLEQKLDLGLFCIADIHRGFIYHCGINLYPSISLIKMNIINTSSPSIFSNQLVLFSDIQICGFFQTRIQFGFELDKFTIYYNYLYSVALLPGSGSVQHIPLISNSFNNSAT